MRTRTALALSLAISALAIASCVPIGAANCASAASSDIITEVVTDKTVYISGESVVVEVTATNVGTDQVELWFPTSLQQGYSVSDLSGYDTIFDIKLHVDTMPFITHMILDPGASDSEIFSGDLSWKQVDDLGTPVLVPAYYIVWGYLDSVSQDYVMGSKTIVISNAATQPAADFTVSSQSGMAGEPFTFDASSSLNTIGQADLLEYRWDWTGDETFDTDWTANPVATHEYGDPGDYTVVLSVRDPAGLEDSASTTVSVIGAVPEFPTVVLPIVAVAVMVLICARKMRKL